MAEKIFPDDYSQLEEPASGTKFMVARASDGKMFYVLLSDVVPDLSGYQAALVSGTNLRTVNGQSLLGSGDLAIESGGGAGLIEPWAAGTYGANVPKTHLLDGKRYLFISKETGNTDEPELGKKAWLVVGNGYPNRYSTVLTYDKDVIVWDNDPADGANFIAYKSKVDSNWNHLPATSSTYWEPLGRYYTTYDPEFSYPINSFVVDPGTYINYLSSVNSNTHPFDYIIPPTNKWELVGPEETDLSVINTVLGNHTAAINNIYGQLDEKVDKVSGKSLILNSEITRLAGVTNQDISGKQNTLVSGTNIKTINGTSVLGAGDIAISGGGGSMTGAEIRTALGITTLSGDNTGDQDLSGKENVGVAAGLIASLKDGNTTDTIATLRTALTSLQSADTTISGQISDLMALLDSDNSALDTIQEIVDYIEANRTSIDAVLVDKLNKSVYDAFLITNASAIAGKEPTITAGTSAQFWLGNKTWATIITTVLGVVLTGLSTATSTAVIATDNILVAIGKLQAQINLLAPLASPTFTGTPSLPTGTTGTTQSAGDSSTKLATTAFVTTAVSDKISNSSDSFGTKVTQIVSCTQAQYDGLTPDSNTFYIII